MAEPGYMTLRTPPGAHDGLISHGAREFRPYLADPGDDGTVWLVDVPLEAAGHLMHNAGFSPHVEYKEAAMTNEMVELIAPNADSASSWERADGVVDPTLRVRVPARHAGALVESHGFSIAPPVPAEEKRDVLKDAAQRLRPPKPEIADRGTVRLGSGNITAAFPVQK